jgi:hypothetical protein
MQSLVAKIQDQSAASSRPRDVQDAGHVDQHDVTMGFEARIGRQLTRADLKLQFHRRATTSIACDTALAYVSRTLGKDPMSENTAVLAAPTLRVAPRHSKSRRYAHVLSGYGARQCKSSVLPTPRFDVR